MSKIIKYLNCESCRKKKLINDIYHACCKDHNNCYSCLITNGFNCQICEGPTEKYQDTDYLREIVDAYKIKKIINGEDYINCDLCKNKIYYKNYGINKYNKAIKFINCNHIICNICFDKYENGSNCLACNNTLPNNYFDILKCDVMIDNETYYYNNLIKEYVNKNNNVVKLFKYNCGHVKIVMYSRIFETGITKWFDHFDKYCQKCSKSKYINMCAVDQKDFKHIEIYKIATRANKYCDIKIICE